MPRNEERQASKIKKTKTICPQKVPKLTKTQGTHNIM